MIAPSRLHKYVCLFQGDQFADTVNEGAKPLARLLKGQCRTGFKPLVTLEQCFRDEASHMLVLANINADVKRLLEQHGNRFETRLGLLFPSHWRVLLRHKPHLYET